MKQLKLVQQLDQHGCTIACFATIVGIPYFEVREMMHRKMDKFKHKTYLPPGQIGFKGVECKEALQEWFGISSEFIKFTSLNQLDRHCILYVSPLSGCWAYIHAIVFDAKSRRLLDPESYGICATTTDGRRQKIENLNGHNVTCCLEIRNQNDCLDNR